MSAATAAAIPLHLKPWLTRAEACIVANVGKETLKSAIYAGALPEYELAGGDRCRRIKRADLDAWIESGRCRRT